MLFSESSLHLKSGQGTGGSEENIGKVDNATECISKCYNKTMNGVYANAVNLDVPSNTSCYCRYGQTGRKDDSNWMNAFIRYGKSSQNPLKSRCHGQWKRYKYWQLINQHHGI